jgi:HSP20 family protein
MLGELQAWSSGWSVLQEMNSFRQDIDRLFERFFADDFVDMATPMWPRAESRIEDGKLIMRFDLPGVDPKDIDVSITGGTVTVKASRERRNTQANGGFEHGELSYGRFERSMTLPKGVKADEIKANYRNGVLELTAPVSAELAGRKTPVEIGANEPKKLEAKTA